MLPTKIPLKNAKYTVPGSGMQETGFFVKFWSSENFPVENAKIFFEAFMVVFSLHLTYLAKHNVTSIIFVSLAWLAQMHVCHISG